MDMPAIQRLDAPALAQYCKCNDPPPDHTRAFLRNALVSRKEAVFQINQQIMSLIQQRQHLESEIGMCNIVLAPIRHTPPEILLHIFRHYLSLDLIERFPPGSTYDINFSPWLLSHVCRDWRKIMLSSSACWSDVRIMFRPTDIQPKPITTWLYRREWDSRTSRRVLHMISQQIMLSHEQPLQLSVGVDCIRTTAGRRGLFDLIQSVSERWKRITVNTTGSTATDSRFGDVTDQIFATEGKHSFPLLEEIRFTTTNPSIRISNKCHFPRLRCLALLAIQHSPELAIHWSRLMELSLFSIETDHILSLLPHLTALRMLEIASFSSVGQPRSPTPIIFPALRTLSIHENYASVLDAIVVPCLVRLQISYWEGTGRTLRPEHETDLSSLLDLIQRSSCTITTFAGRILTTKSTLRSFLHAIPKVTEMDIEILIPDRQDFSSHDARFGDFFQLLGSRNTASKGSFIFCPLLGTLSFGNYRKLKVHGDDIIKLLTRRNEGKHLRSVLIRHSQNLMDDHKFMHNIGALRGRGLVIDLQGSDEEPYYEDAYYDSWG